MRVVLGNAWRDPQEALALRDMMLDLRYCDGSVPLRRLAGVAGRSRLLEPDQ